MAKRYKVIVYVPVADADKLRQVMGEVGAGKIGNYDFCSFSTRGVGRFRPLKGANPGIGEIDKHEQVEEERIEVVVDEPLLEKLLSEIKNNHPYEEPAIDIMELKNL
jgi:hypothetical protein